MQGKKTGGRVAGTQNKITIELRNTIKELIAKELESLPGLFGELSPKERIEI